MVKKEAKKRGRKICSKCSKYINLYSDHYVEISTFNRQYSPNDHTFWHFQCWIDYFNECVEKRARENVRAMQEKAMSIFASPVMRNLLSQIQGSGIALNMLQTPLRNKDLEIVVPKEQVIAKIQNDRKKRNKRKRSRR